MTHAGTIDLGASAGAKPGGRPRPAVVLTLVVVVATIAAVWLASSAGLVGGISAKPAPDQEAQRAAVTLSSDRLQYLNGILDRAHAAPYAAAAVPLSSDRLQYLNGILDRAHAAPYAAAAVTLSSDRLQYLNGILDRAHAAPYASNVVTLPLVPTPGTFHPSKEADQQMAPVKRDRVGGP